MNLLVRYRLKSDHAFLVDAYVDSVWTECYSLDHQYSGTAIRMPSVLFRQIFEKFPQTMDTGLRFRGRKIFIESTGRHDKECSEAFSARVKDYFDTFNTG